MDPHSSVSFFLFFFGETVHGHHEKHKHMRDIFWGQGVCVCVRVEGGDPRALKSCPVTPVANPKVSI